MSFSLSTTPVSGTTLLIRFPDILLPSRTIASPLKMALIYCDDTFRGTYTMGTRANLPVRPEDAWFPASLDQTFRERFLAEPKADNIAAFISELSIAETRASQQALSV
jgi:hypothetical protein